MPFKEQMRAVGYVPHQRLGLLIVKLGQVGYEKHDGPRTTRDREVATLRKGFPGSDGWRQNHVQVVQRGRTCAVYAHTEPHTGRFLDHAASALLDEASFSGGSRMLRNDLASIGFRLMSFEEAQDSAA